VEPLTEPIVALRKAVDSFLNGDDASRGAIFAAVFILNNRLGPTLRKSQSPVLRELQLRVNDVTVATKLSDKSRLAVAMKSVEAASGKLEGT